MRVAARRDAPFVIQVAYTENVMRQSWSICFLFSRCSHLCPFVAVSGVGLWPGSCSGDQDISMRAKDITASNLSGRMSLARRR